MSRVGPWHEGHILGGYQNPKCASCQREERTRLKWEKRQAAASPKETPR